MKRHQEDRTQPGRVTRADREVFRKYGEWLGRLPPISPPPPRTIEQLCEWMETWCKPNAPLIGDHDEAVARLTGMRTRFLERDRRQAGSGGA